MAFCGDIDEISRARILGWAMDSEDPDAALELGVVVNGVRGQDATYGNYAYSYNYYPTRQEPSADSPTS